MGGRSTQSTKPGRARRGAAALPALMALFLALSPRAQAQPTVYTNMPQIGIWSTLGPPDFYTFGAYSFTFGGAPAWYWGYPSGWNYWFGPTVLYYNRAILPPPMMEITRRIDPETQSMVGAVPSMEPPAVPPDEGLEALRTHDYARAITVYERRVQERLTQEASAPAAPPADRRALRLLALALAGADRFDEAADAFNRAHAEDPGLDAQPLIGADALGSTSEMRRVVLASVRHAQKTGTAAAWRLVARLMQAEGREDQSQRMFLRAAEIERSTAPAQPASPPAIPPPPQPPPPESP